MLSVSHGREEMNCQALDTNIVAVLFLPVLLLSAVVQAAPIGGQVVSGAGEISQSGTTTTIQQSSQNLSLTWDGFNIAAQETVNFQQPSASAIAVNRIFDINGTKVLGHLNANGQVYLINPNGILFGQGAQLNVGGLVASTLDLNEATLNSNARSFSGTGTGSIVNQGTINAASGGYVALLGNQVSNQGVITAQLGSVALGAGSAATLTFNGNALVSMQIDQSTLNNLAENKQLIRADGGQVLMTAGAKDTLLASVVNNTGVIEARTVENRNGTIILLGGMEAGQANVAGTLDASAPNGGDGGFIETSAAYVKVANDAKVTTAAANGEAGTWLIDPVDFTIAAAGGDMTGATLSTNLGLGNVNIQSSSGADGTAGDVNVNDTVTWSANKLTLNALNNININADMTASATASLALEYGQGALAAGNSSDIITTGASVTLPAGTANFTTKQGSDGTLKNYTVITSLGAEGSTTTTDLQGMDGGLTLNYALGSNIDATATSGWNVGEGFQPVGTFSGTFDGLGHTISGLTINRTTNQVGLFGVTAANAEIRNLGLVGGSISGASRVGGLVGETTATRIRNSYTTGTVTGTSSYVGGLVGILNASSTISGSYIAGTVNGTGSVGGLVGYQSSSTIDSSYTTGTVTVTGTSNNVGGLVGEFLSSSTISDSYAEGNVSGASVVGGLVGSHDSSTINGSHTTGTVDGTSRIGGLVGYQSGGTIGTSYTTGTVTGTNNNVGGLVGEVVGGGAISGSYATGAVSGTGSTGGLVGVQNGNSTISGSHTTSTVNGTTRVGGLVGFQGSGTIGTSYTMGTVTGTGNNVGGLVGEVGGGGAISGSYAEGAVSGASIVGGLVGVQSGNSTISDSYATGITSGANWIGGLVGYQSGSTISDSYATGNATGTGNNVGGLVGQQLSSMISGSHAIGSASGVDDVGGLVGRQNASTISTSYATGNATATGIDVGGLVGYQLTSSTISDSYAAGVVTGVNNVGGLVGRQVSSTIADSFWDTTTTGQATSAGEGAGTATGMATADMQVQTNFTSATAANGSVDPAWDFTNTWVMTEGFTYPRLQSLTTLLTVAANNDSKTYDALAYSGGNGVTYNGFIDNDTSAALGGTLAYAGTSQGAVNAGSYVITPEGLTSNKYLFSYTDGSLTVNPAALTLSTSDVSKTYDGGLTAAGTAVVSSGTLFGSDSISGGSFAFTDKNAGAGNKVVTTTGATVMDGNGGGNYSVSYADNTTSTITPASLMLSGITASNKVFDGTTAAAVITEGAIYTGLITGDDVRVNASGLFADKNVGIGKTVMLTSSYTGLDVGNYNITDQASTTANITGGIVPQTIINAIAQLNTQLGMISSFSSGSLRSRLQAPSTPLIVKYRSDSYEETEDINGEGSGARLIIMNGGISASDDKD